MLTTDRYGCVVNSATGERACPKTPDIRSTFYPEAPKPKPGTPSKPSGPPVHPPIHPPHIPPTKPPGPAAGDNRGTSGGDLRDSGVTNITNRAARNTIKGALDTFKPAKVTTNEIPKTARQLAELSDFAYAHSELLRQGADHLDIKDAWNGRIDSSFRDYVDALGRPSNDTRAKFGDLDTSLSNEATMIFHNPKTKTTRAVMRGAAGEQTRAARGQLSESNIDKLFEESYFENLRKAAVKYGKVDEAHGYSLGGGAAHRAVAKGLAGEAISINGFVKDSVLQSGKHTLISQPYDLQHVLNHIVPNAGHNNPNVTKIVTPSRTPQSASGPLSAYERMADAHRFDHFLDGGPEGADPVVTQRTAEEMANVLRPPSLADDAATLLRESKGPTLGGKIASGAKNFAKGAGINMVGALLTDEALDAAGVENEYVKDVAGGVGGAALESAALGTAFAAEAGPIGLAGGIGAAEGAYLANRVGATGWGKTGIVAGAGIANAALGTVALTNFWNPFGLIAAGIMGIEALAVGIDAATHHEEDDHRATMRVPPKSKMQAVRESDADIADDPGVADAPSK